MRGRPFVSFVMAACGAVFAACGGGAPAPVSPPPAASTANPSDDRSGFEGKDFELVRSDRFGVSVPLPDRHAWTVADRDDQQGGWFVATHAPTSTVVRMRRYEETSLVGRRECETRAMLVGELPREEVREQRGFQSLTDEPIHRPKGWDGWRYVAFEPRPAGRLLGHVFLVTGRAHSCLVVHVLAEVAGDHEANALADRLELFASRVVAAIVVDRAAEPGPIKPDFPTLPPTPGAP